MPLQRKINAALVCQNTKIGEKGKAMVVAVPQGKMYFPFLRKHKLAC